MKSFWQTILTLFTALLLSVAGSAAYAQDLPPRPDGPIYDGADILSPATEASLDSRLREYNATTGRAIVVATVPDLGGEEIDPYATNLFAAWGIGGAERDQGLLLLIARDDRKMRIEVGYGLHPYFGGIMAGRVIRNDITPRFKAGDFDGGVNAGIDAILAHLAKSPADAQAIAEAAAAAEQSRSSSGGGFPISAIFWFFIILFFFVIPMLRGGGRGRRRYRSGIGGTVGDIILWEAGKAVARGLSDSGGGFGGGGFGSGGGGGFGGFGGGMSGGGGASGGW
ncbi:TPM domain-containing protein [Pontixanthobacter sp. CEM42]|uniref:TPM domain-containing protein n=1 Tax=Pontixanthobacter sp. CEM42 TaxID=2792077 RepID=UPI001ADF79C6|nr:TPM domain-containing protein [Pontixanthobacter sp. CEM42]